MIEDADQALQLVRRAPAYNGCAKVERAGETICGRCGDVRAVDALVWQTHLNCGLAILTCRQCSAEYVLLMYTNESGPAAVLAPRQRDTAHAPQAPDAVLYYCDQARRCRSVAANSAAVVMFRAAVEQVFANKGFTRATLGAKLVDLETARTKGDPSADWAQDLDTDLIRHLKILGDAGAHGDATVQAEYDAALVDSAELAVRALLHHVYEEPHKKKTFQDALRAKANLVKR